MSPLKSSRLTEAKQGSRPEPRRWPIALELTKASTVSTAKLVIVLGRAYRSLVGFLEGGLALQGISAADFAIMEALLHKGPLAASVIATKIALVPNAAVKLAIGRLVRRGLIRRQTSRSGSATEVVELTPEGRKQITGIYEKHEREIQAVLGVLSSREQKQLREFLRRIGLQADRYQHARSKDHRGGLAPWQLRRVTHYMTEHVADSVPLEDLAAQTGLSSSQFRRAFKSSTGISPHRWQTQLRILEAQELLREGNVSLADVSLATGFAEQSHFSRVFKDVVGISPGAWQREHRP
jgi:AraC-like DNA-binding protein/DNA-binding MarR family transcriptional regulator